MKLQLIETPDYILAVSDEEIKDGFGYDGNIWEILHIGTGNNQSYGFCYVKEHNLEHLGYSKVRRELPSNLVKIIAYQPKNNAPELDLPLLPKIVVEDDVEKLAMDELKNKWSHLYQFGYPKRPFPTNYEHDLNMIMLGYYKAKVATKTYSEEDLRKAYQTGEGRGRCSKTGVQSYLSEEEFIQSLKQPKTPKWFVAETEYDCCNRYQNCIGCDATAEMINLRLKTTTINNKTYLVGTYLNQ